MASTRDFRRGGVGNGGVDNSHHTKGFGRRSHFSQIAVESHADEDLSIAASDDFLDAEQQGELAPVDMVRGETRAISCLRYLILLLLLVMGGGLTYGLYELLIQADECSTDTMSASFELNDATVNAYVQGLDDNLRTAQEQLLSSAHTLSVSLSTMVIDWREDGIRTQQWPQVTASQFDQRVAGILSFDEVNEVRLAPFVDPFMRLDFEGYAAVQQQADCTTGNCPIFRTIYNVDGTPLDTSQSSSPLWQISPFDPSSPGYRMMNQLSDPIQADALDLLQSRGSAVWTGPGNGVADETSTSFLVFYPIFDDARQEDLVASLSLQVDIESMIERSLPFHVDQEVTVLVSKSTFPCATTSESHSFSVKKNSVSYSGVVDAGSTTNLRAAANAAILDLPSLFAYGEFNQGLSSATAEACPLEFVVIPSGVTAISIATAELSVDEGSSNQTVALTATVAGVFFVVIILFLVYDWLSERRQAIVLGIATKSTAIVENLFPAPVRDRMYQNILDAKKNGGGTGPGSFDPSGMMGDAGISPIEGGNSSMKTNGAPGGPDGAVSQVSVKQFLTTNGSANNDLSSQPIADLFPNTTVLFMDIAGFTAWSSQRDPPQVFTLLETLYRSFDKIAGKLKVFKVETIGDCYMAVTGLPNPDDHHAVHMSRFAYQCLMSMKTLIRELEGILGPGTSDLALRVGLHSGPVTAGVLRGEKSRFQLFGDTVNTASRMESTGEREKIQVSQETADLLMAAGKSHWLKPREELIVAKGKGELKTYWLDPTKKRRHHKGHKDIRVAQEIALDNGIGNPSVGPGEAPLDEKYARLIDWNVDVLLHHLARVISSRARSPARGSLVNHSSEVALLPAAIKDVAEVVALPPFDPDNSKFRRVRPDVSMLQQTRADLHEYVKRIALTYRDVPFHNFEHASHVTLCANKLLNRLINSEEYESEEALHNSTFGISGDPLTHFAIVFSALIHDADHQGVPNAQLVKEKDEVAAKFNNKSVAEQNSVHLGWELLMDPRFERLRKSIYSTNVERKRFRQLVINCVLATDIADREVNEARKVKWEKAFRSTPAANPSPLQIQEDMNRKGTAVIEQIIQVSDVAHTMQHWHIYRRWNERLFHEMHDAYVSGRVSVDPSTNWYIGELGFFDYYLIPLAMRLKECGVFGASGTEYISYVLKNKKEWERKGRQVVQEMVLLYKDTNEEEEDESSLGSEDYDSDDLEYDSPGDLTESEEGDEIESQS